MISYRLEGVPDNTGLSLSITNTAGQLVKTLYLNKVQNNTQYAVNVNGSGIYLMQVTLTDGQRFTKKIVVTK